MATITEVSITAGVPSSGTGEVPTLAKLLALPAVTVAFLPSAGAHGALDSVGGAMTFSNVGYSGAIVRVTKVILTIETTTPTATAYKLVLLNSDLTTPLADNAVWAPVTADAGKLLAIIDIPQPVDGTSTLQYQFAEGLSVDCPLTTANLVGYLLAVSAVTFEAVDHNVTLISYPIG